MHTLPSSRPTVGKSSQSPQNLFPTSSAAHGALLVGAMLGLTVTSVQFAHFLNTPLGRKWDAQHTWFMTVVGVMFTLAWLALHDPRAAMKAFAFFMISGMPIVIRALSLSSATLEALVERGD